MVDLTIANTIVGATLVAIGWIFKQAFEMWKQARGRRKTEVQKLTEERDKSRTLKYRWRSAYYAAEVLALKHGVKQDELPRTPDDR